MEVKTKNYGINKKVKNTKKIIIDDILFRSHLEGICYKKLKEAGINPNYETERYILFEGFKPNKNLHLYIPIYKSKKIVGFGRYEGKIQNITYTPDFTFNYNGYMIIIEVKGNPNDAYPNKRKQMFSVLEEYTKDISENSDVKGVMFFEPHNTSQIEETINIIKSL